MSNLRHASLGFLAPLALAAAALAQDAAMLRFEATGVRGAQPDVSLLGALPQGEIVYDTLWITDEGAANAGVGNAIGGIRAFPSLGTIDSQFADDFHLDATSQITTVFVDCQSFFNGDAPDEGFRVQFYPNDGVKPKEDVLFDITLTDFTREFKGMFANRETYRYQLDLSGSGVVLDAGDWWMDVQPLDVSDGGWFWSLSVLDLTPPEGNHAHVRDGWLAHGNSYHGLWNSTVWLEHNFRGRATPARRILATAQGGPRLRLSGECPGLLGIEITGMTPNGIIAILIGFQTGSYEIPGGACQGTVLGLSGQGLRIAGRVRADANGNFSSNHPAGTAACGKYLQAIDARSCGTTNVVQID